MPPNQREITFMLIVQGSPKKKQETRRTALSAVKAQSQKSEPSPTLPVNNIIPIISPTGLSEAALTI